MPSCLRIGFTVFLGLACSGQTFADLNKCVDPTTKKAFFTDAACPAGVNREKSIATNANSSQRFSASDETDKDPQVARLRAAKTQAIREYEKAQSDYRFAKNNYTDQNAIQLAFNRAKTAEEALANAHHNLLSAVNPAQAANFQQQRNAAAIREQHEASQQAARQTAIEDAQRRQEESNDRQRLAQEVQQLRQQQAATAEAASRAESAANNAANAAANSGNRGPAHCYQKMNGHIYCN